MWKATKEIHHTVDPEDPKDAMLSGTLQLTLGGAIFQILLLDLVFSIDSIITAVGMTDEIAIMYIAVIVAVSVMMLAATRSPTSSARTRPSSCWRWASLLMIGMTLIADGMGFHVPKGYIYAAMGFSALVEGLNMLARRSRDEQEGDRSGHLTGSAPLLQTPSRTTWSAARAGCAWRRSASGRRGTRRRRPRPWRR